MTGVETFRALHHDRAPGDPLILPGPWDPPSARTFVAAGFPALAVPSAGVAEALGYEDGETPADEMFAAVARIVRAAGVPVSADLEDGYGLAPKELVERALEAGAVGMNLEDSRPGGILKEPRAHAEWLAEVRTEAGDRLFVNARVDTFLHGGKDPDEAIERALLYRAAGADCIYPIMAPPEHFTALRAETDVPVNAFTRSNGPTPAELGRLGATRITFGPGLLRRSMAALGDIARGLGGA
ncbi:isocitrate lyase/PEP mutase family protein [Streptomyces purpureus]|uniref:Carboxyvinyl-carboxyphosphonate phosphorylmutase n=1 Tax=Streptomyces purpureus TaxID=1951 RepID=A0A918HEP2_9ACTN|nr:isocitrate lyase/phosphoenolpyruvate mutase family protein [Streptomyces purpureus]GGT58923.1 carboxyvinyl-carboxyphosphonate phosphorylmutase [Streptomyces purpureus]